MSIISYLADLSADLLKFNSLLITMRDSATLNTHPAAGRGSSRPRGSGPCTTSPAARGGNDSRTPWSQGSCTAPAEAKILEGLAKINSRDWLKIEVAKLAIKSFQDWQEKNVYSFDLETVAIFYQWR